jgi:hypothetical protein
MIFTPLYYTSEITQKQENSEIQVCKKVGELLIKRVDIPGEIEPGNSRKHVRRNTVDPCASRHKMRCVVAG